MTLRAGEYAADFLKKQKRPRNLPPNGLNPKS